MRPLVAAIVFVFAGTVHADDAAFRYFFDLAPRSVEELDTITQTLLPEANRAPDEQPIVVVLHGDEANAFLRSNYNTHQSLVDRTALLDAYGVIQVKMCATWMRLNGIQASDIPPFIETVRFGPAEIERLQAQGDRPLPDVEI